MDPSFISFPVRTDLTAFVTREAHDVRIIHQARNQQESGTKQILHTLE
jgi:hypothetical protein